MRKLLFLVTALLFAGSLAWGQMPHGTITGTIMGEDNGTVNPIPFAHVVAFPPNGLFPAGSAFADSMGNYILNLREGDYQVRAEAMHFVAEWYDNVVERPQATVLHVTEDNNPTGIDFILVHNEPPPPPQFPGSIAGMVTDTAGVPLIRARVQADGRDWRHHFSIFTDSSGAYLLANLPPDTYHVTAMKEDFRPGEYPHPVQVDSQAVTGIDIQLVPVPPPPPPPTGAISGIVTDGVTGDPIEGARVIAEGRNFHRDAMTLADGSYAIHELPAGSYQVVSHKMGYFPATYPDPVEVGNSEVTGINLVMAPYVETGIDGIVTDAATSNPIAYAMVVAINVADPRMHLSARTNDLGAYHIHALPGEYVVQAVAMGYWMLEYPQHVVVTDGIISGINFALVGIDFGSIAGTVTDTAGNPVTGAVVEARKVGGRFQQHTRTDSTGAYLIENIMPGTYRIIAFARGFAPGSYPDSVVVTEGQDITGIDIVLGVIQPPFNGTISGTVLDDSTGTPIVHAMVMAIGGRPEYGRFRWHYRYTFSDSNGYYHFGNLPEAPFKIFAAARGHIGEFYNNVYRYSEATPVTPNAENINFSLAPRPNGIRSIAGWIDIPYGFETEGNIVYAMVDDEIVAATLADPFGYYSFDDLETGTYDITSFSVEGNGQVGHSISITSEDVTDADIVFNPTSVDDATELLPQSSALSQNYPNPFNAQTQIAFEISSTSNVELSVFNVMGQKVATLADGHFGAGSYTVIWNGLDTNGNPISSGIYYYQLKTDYKTDTKKMTLLK